MKIVQDNNNVYVKDIRDFDLGQTMECGQCFHFNKLGEDEYGLVASGRFLHAKQEGSDLCLLDTTTDEAESFWIKYFDLERDYSQIKSMLLKEDEKLSEAIETMWGVRILNQEFFETLISFIISQNKQIPHIKQIVATISRLYGNYLAKAGNFEFYSFPTPEQMKNVTVEDLKECKTGFRAPYIKDAIDHVLAGKMNEDDLRAMPVMQCNQQLMSIKGVGVKVANCVSLFGLGHREAFPVDVWIKRIVETLYFDGIDTPAERIGEFGTSRFGEFGGYAQQYLFYYGKTIKMGVKK